MSYAVMICDDDPASLAELRSALHGFDLVEATTADAARETLAKRSVDAIVAASLEVLHLARTGHPASIRFLVSDAPLEIVVREVNDGVAHRFFQKPCDAVTLRGALEVVLGARES